MKTYRLFLSITYDGGKFDGWQSQASANGIQDHIEKAFLKITGEKLRVHGAGRTDAGVHALAQRAHVDVPECSVPMDRWIFALNDSLPPAIRIDSARRVKSDFHARFDALGKCYEYAVWNDKFMHPFRLGKAWHVIPVLDPKLLKQCADLLIGKHDFKGFAANRGKPEENTVRTIQSIAIRREGKLLRLRYEGDGFLYRMVRLLTGGIVRVASEKSQMSWLEEVLGGVGKCQHCAPADGLTLVKVKY